MKRLLIETKFENLVVMNENGGNVIIKTNEDVILNRVLYNTYFQSGKTKKTGREE
jgi:hypothetical protein